jgi:magnesium chelatase family protein
MNRWCATIPFEPRTIPFIGGGCWPKPGEINLVHRDLLLLDELIEFGTHKLEILYQPLEDKTVVIGRSAGTLTYPANFILVGSMNLCPYGFCSNDCARWGGVG